MKITETKITFICDLCRRNVYESDLIKVNYPVYWNSNQTDGNSSKPYIEQTDLELCQTCQKEVIKIEGSGAMGNNSYHPRTAK